MSNRSNMLMKFLSLLKDCHNTECIDCPLYSGKCIFAVDEYDDYTTDLKDWDYGLVRNNYTKLRLAENEILKLLKIHPNGLRETTIEKKTDSNLFNGYFTLEDVLNSLIKKGLIVESTWKCYEITERGKRW